MSTPVRIRDTDRGATKLLARLLAHGALSVGVLGSDAAKVHEDESNFGEGFGQKSSSLTIGELAEIHEFGLGSVPRRSFLAGWVDDKREELVNVIVKGGRALARGKLTAPKLLEQIGLWAVGSIQERMANGIAPGLARETIRRKGSSVPLIDTGQLRSSISHRVDAVDMGGGTVGIKAGA